MKMRPNHHKNITGYNYDYVQQLWEDCIKYDIQFDDLYDCRTDDEYNSNVTDLQKNQSTQGRDKRWNVYTSIKYRFWEFF